MVSSARERASHIIGHGEWTHGALLCFIIGTSIIMIMRDSVLLPTHLHAWVTNAPDGEAFECTSMAEKCLTECVRHMTCVGVDLDFNPLTFW